METTFHFYDPAHPLKPYAYSLPGQTTHTEHVLVPPVAPPYDADGTLPVGWTPPEPQFAEVIHEIELPDHAILSTPKDRHGFWPVLNAKGDGWDYVEDHRQRKDERDRIIEGTGTMYWLAPPQDEGDTWQSPARYMTDIGPLPDGAMLRQPVKTREDLATDLRSQRDRRITATDYLMAVDYPLDDAQRTAWSAYRQALRDMPQAEGFPWDGGGEDTPWPEKPVASAQG